MSIMRFATSTLNAIFEKFRDKTGFCAYKKRYILDDGWRRKPYLEISRSHLILAVGINEIGDPYLNDSAPETFKARQDKACFPMFGRYIKLGSSRQSIFGSDWGDVDFTPFTVSFSKLHNFLDRKNGLTGFCEVWIALQGQHHTEVLRGG